jgi:hypothetical protein
MIPDLRLILHVAEDVVLAVIVAVAVLGCLRIWLGKPPPVSGPATPDVADGRARLLAAVAEEADR